MYCSVSYRGIYSSPFAPQVIFKTDAAILAVEQRLLCYNTCRRSLILRSDNSSGFALAGAHCAWGAGMLLLAGDLRSFKQLVGVLYLPEKENYPLSNTKSWLSALIKA